MAFITTIAFLAAAQGIFLGLVLIFLKRGNRRSNQSLGWLIFIYALWTAEFAAYFTEQLYHYPHLLFVTLNVPLLFGPLLFFYADSLGSKKRSSTWTLIHFAPFAIFIALQFPYFLTSATDKLEALRALRNLENPPDYSLGFFLREVFKSLHLSLYLWFSYRIFHDWKSTSDNTTLEHRTRRRWLLILIVGLGLYAIFDIIHFVGLYLYAYDYLFLIAKGVLLSGAVVIYYIGYVTIRRPVLLDDLNQSNSQQAKVKYAKSGLTEMQAAQYLQHLRKTMEDQQPYLDPNLSLQSLSDIVSISPHHLSQVINTQLQKSFSEFVNEYRIATAKKKLADSENQHFTILSIAYDSGFKNKASFNNAFKKMTGITPSIFRSNRSQLIDPT